MDLESTLTSRDTINSQLRGVLDDATGKWGLRVNRVEIKAIDPPKTIKDAMEKQMRAERDKRAAILSAEGQRQSQILTAEGDKQGAILRAEGDRTAAILRGRRARRAAIDQVFQAVHRNDPDPKLLAYQYLQMLPQLAQRRGQHVLGDPQRGHLRAAGRLPRVHRRRGRRPGRREPDSAADRHRADQHRRSSRRTDRRTVATAANGVSAGHRGEEPACISPRPSSRSAAPSWRAACWRAAASGSGSPRSRCS